MATPFSRNDVLSFYGQQDGLFNPASVTLIEERTDNAILSFRNNHIIQCNEFDTIYCTSDIHSDFRKFIQMLKLNGLITTPINPYEGNSIYAAELISDIIWSGGNRVLLVIVGDLIDGRRSYNSQIFNSPDDPYGSFELLLLAFLYNLRIKANEVGSEVLFTLGNHDHMTIVRRSYEDDYFYTKYVTTEADRFFRNRVVRRKALLPFYTLFCFYYLSLRNGDIREIAFVHGGLHANYSGADLTERIEIFQTDLDNGERSISDFEDVFPLPADSETSPLWTRYYTVNPNGVCDKIQGTQHKLIIVGHCPTNIADNNRYTTLLQKPEYSTICENGSMGDTRDGCVYLDCMSPGHDHGAPRLAFVDVGLSKGQRFPTWQTTPEISNEARNAQLLRLRHDPNLSDSRYFNVLERVVTTDVSEVLYSAPIRDEATMGGRRYTRSHRKKYRNKKTRQAKKRHSRK